MFNNEHTYIYVNANWQNSPLKNTKSGYKRCKHRMIIINGQDDHEIIPKNIYLPQNGILHLKPCLRHFWKK